MVNLCDVLVLRVGVVVLFRLVSYVPHRECRFQRGSDGLGVGAAFRWGAAGNVVGGYLSDQLVKRLGVKNGRRILGCVSLTASSILLVAMSQAHGKFAVAILAALGFGVADLMLPSAWAVCLDVGGAYAGAVTGFMNTAGQLGGFVCSVLYGYVVQVTGSYNLPLAIVASMVLISAMLFANIDASRAILEATETPFAEKQSA